MLKEFIRKHRILLGIELLCVLMLLLSCFIKKEEVRVLEVPGMWQYSSDEAVEFYKSDSFSLDAGVYRLVAQASGKTTDSVAIGVRGWDCSYRAIRCNDVTFPQEENYLEFEVYVTEAVEDAALIAIDSGNGIGQLEKVTLYSTNIGNRICLFLLLVVFFLADYLIACRSAILEGKICAEKIWAGLLIVGSIVVACQPLMVDYYVAGGETREKMVQIEMLKNAFAGEGKWVWKSVHLILPALLRAVGFSIMTSYKAYIFSVICFMGILTYMWFHKIVDDRMAASIGSAAYTIMPGRLLRLYGGLENHSWENVLTVGWAVFVAFLVVWCLKQAENSFKYDAGVIALTIFIYGWGMYKMNTFIFEAAPARVYNIEYFGKVSLLEENIVGFEEITSLVTMVIFSLLVVGGKQIIWKRKRG